MEKEFHFLVYRSAEEDVSVNAFVKDESIWLSQKGMAELFQTSKQTISYHINNCFKERELDRQSVVKEFLTTATDGKKDRLRVPAGSGRVEKSHSQT